MQTAMKRLKMAESNVKYADMKHIFLSWKSQTKQKIEKKKCHALAHKIYQLSTYNESWQRWNQHLEMRKIMKHMKLQAKTIHLLSIFQENFHTWRKQCEHVRTCRVKSKQLRVLYQRKLLTSCFVGWKNYSGDYQKTTTGMIQLNRMSRNIWCRKVMTRWKSVVEQKSKQGALVFKALEFRIIEIFNAWYREFNLNKYKNRRMNELMQIRNLNLCKACFEQWKKYLIIQFQENVKIKKLSMVYRRIQLRRDFLNWRQWERDKHSERQALVQKQREVNKIFVKHLFEIWRKKQENSKVLNQKIARIKDIHGDLVQMKYLQIWKNYSRERSLRKLTSMKVKKYVNKLELKIYLSYWRQQLVVEYRNKDKTTQALIQWSKQLTRKTFNAWVQYTQKKTPRKSRYSQAMELHKSFVLKQGLRSFLVKGVNEIVQKNEQVMETSYQNEKILFKYFTRWKHCVRYNDDFVHLKKSVVHLSLTSQPVTSTSTYRPRKQPGALQMSGRFSNVTRNEPKIPQFLFVNKCLL